LAPEPITSPRIDLLVNALREQTKNERIFAEHCDVSSPRSVRDFCTKFLTGQETRIDALVFAHEYAHVGSVLPRPSPDDVKLDQQARTDGSMATFLMITLLLPALLVAPTERDIRVVSLVNPFYAAAAPSFNPDEPFHGIDQSEASKPPSSSTFLLEGRRALRTAILMRHLQRVLDALPNRGQAPATDSTQATVPVVSGNQQRSNIVSVAVSPGFSRSDTVSRILGATHDGPRFSTFGLFLLVYFLLPYEY
jgi:NAD(P)-dependent dehydrogenase (short-subunit alcohol dehydrogenase family)